MAKRSRKKADADYNPPMGIENQPLTKLQWLDRSELNPNLWNPNNVAPLELELLKVSILEDGWTMPLVIRADKTIIDGFHRWSVSEDPLIYAMTGGKVPCVILPSAVSIEHQMMSTIRHNRARGSHYVLKMADIVAELIQSGTSHERIMHLLGMESEEVNRLAERGNMVERGSEKDFGAGWVPGHGN